MSEIYDWEAELATDRSILLSESVKDKLVSLAAFASSTLLAIKGDLGLWHDRNVIAPNKYNLLLLVTAAAFAAAGITYRDGANELKAEADEILDFSGVDNRGEV
jgi:hypothetical protein